MSKNVCSADTGLEWLAFPSEARDSPRLARCPVEFAITRPTCAKLGKLQGPQPECSPSGSRRTCVGQTLPRKPDCSRSLVPYPRPAACPQDSGTTPWPQPPTPPTPTARGLRRPPESPRSDRSQPKNFRGPALPPALRGGTACRRDGRPGGGSGLRLGQCGAGGGGGRLCTTRPKRYRSTGRISYPGTRSRPHMGLTLINTVGQPPGSGR